MVQLQIIKQNLWANYFEDIEKVNTINELYEINGKKFKQEKFLEKAKIFCLVLEFVENSSLGNYLSKHKEKYYFNWARFYY